MRRTSRGILVVVVVSFVSISPVMGLIQLNDGGVWDIDYEINDDVLVDHHSPGMGTTVNMLDGGSIGVLRGFEDSIINVLGGSIGDLWASGSSQATVSGGSIDGELRAYGSSQVTVSGGSIYWMLWAFDSSQVAVSGGAIGYNLYAFESSQVAVSGVSIGGDLYANNNSQISFSGGVLEGDLLVDSHGTVTIYGSDFAVDGTPVGYIELMSILGLRYGAEPYRRLTGTLLSGEPINNDFQIGYSAKMVLVPEPATLLLLGTGGLMLRRRRHELF